MIRMVAYFCFRILVNFLILFLKLVCRIVSYVADPVFAIVIVKLRIYVIAVFFKRQRVGIVVVGQQHGLN